MIERAFVTLSEGQMHLRRRHGGDGGDGGGGIGSRAAGGNPLLLFHASPASSWVMQSLMTALVGAGLDRTMIAPDTLGNGDSVAPTPDMPDIAYFADAKLRMIDTLGIDKVDLYGAHTGARIACEFAAAYPDRVGKVILDGITEYDDATRQLVIEKYAPKVEPDEYGLHLLWAFNFVRDQHFFFPYFKRDPAHRLSVPLSDPATLHRITLDVLKALDTYSKPYVAAFAYRAFTRMPAIEAPVLLLKPDTELPVLNAAIDTALGLIRDARVATITGGDTAKAAAIAEFLA
ncbi:alpha/beta hydrolase [Sphingomonas faeni]|uniref:alpha/beta hydrolase n=1 Tax=Sphingomonas faeni TaxID=185950 RepID=UPI0020C7F316|nr:alpha/beta hydrolase [Sphingomonas faeni]MCP8890739.1 alpha/beta hydrolase [Sphingomonas faeni]